jgi:uncharacterized protein YecA (UPF0149 family)
MEIERYLNHEFTYLFTNENRLYESDFFIPERKIEKRLVGKRIIPMDKVLRTPNRNDLCPCDSGLKFKKCCGK